MSSAPPAEPEGAASHAGEAPKKKSKMLLIIILVVILLGGGGGGFFYFQHAKAKADAAAKEKGKDKEEASEEEADEEEADDSEEEESTKESSHDEEKKSKSKEKKSSALLLPHDKDVKHVIPLDPFVLNLADSEGNKFLRVSLGLGIGGEAEGGEGKEEKPDPLLTARMRNALLGVLMTQTSDQVLSIEGKKALCKELLKAAKKVSKEPEIEAIYITEFIVQR